MKKADLLDLLEKMEKNERGIAKAFSGKRVGEDARNRADEICIIRMILTDKDFAADMAKIYG